MNDGDRLKIVQWLLDREDKLRGSTRTGGGLVLTAHTILFAVLVKIFQEFLSLPTPRSSWIILILLMTLLSLITSIFYALTSSVLFRRSDKVTGIPYKNRYFFNARSTIIRYGRNEPIFKEEFCSASENELTFLALSELIAAQHLYRIRHRNLRFALILFLFTMLLMFINIAIIFILKYY